MSERVDAIVLGGGLAGAAVAYHLAERGVGRVVAFEERTPAAGATGRAAGIVSEQMWNRWDVDVVRATRAEYEDLARRLAPGAYRTNGFLRWTADPDVAAALRGRTEELRAWGVDVRSVSRSEVKALLPATRTDDLEEASYAPNDGVVVPSTLAEVYVAEGRQRGVLWRLGSPIRDLRPVDGLWRCSERGTTYTAPVAIVAAGAWSKRVLAGAGFPLPLCPYRTQAAVVLPEGGAGASVPSFHDLDTDVYARPEENGRLIAGDGTERVEADPETFVPTGDESFIEHLAETFSDRLPGWPEVGLIRAWAGVCVSTPDRRPLIGPVPGAAGLYVITGFNGFGVMRAGGAAAWLADVVAGRGDAALERLAPVLPSRFPGPVPAFAPREGFTLEGGDDPRY